MLCKNPYMAGALPFGCGQCFPCRLNRRRLWTHRMVLETLKHAHSSFVTLTYNDENAPKNGSLVPKDTQDWLKRLRKEIAPLKVRYFLVGEYGDHTQRPHYHVALYGLGPEHVQVIEKTWKKGFVQVSGLGFESAQYIAGYVTKKMTAKDDERLNGRFPEFARMSLRPGIGALAMEDIKTILETEHGADLLANTGDVPNSLRHGSKKWPLGRYLMTQLRKAYGFKDAKTPEEVLYKYAEKMSQLFKDSQTVKANRSKSFKKIIIEKNAQKILNMETRAKIYSKKGII